MGKPCYWLISSPSRRCPIGHGSGGAGVKSARGGNCRPTSAWRKSPAANRPGGALRERRESRAAGRPGVARCWAAGAGRAENGEQRGGVGRRQRRRKRRRAREQRETPRGILAAFLANWVVLTSIGSGKLPERNTPRNGLSLCARTCGREASCKRFTGIGLHQSAST